MIKKIKWKDSNVLGSLELDFTKPDGTVYNTVVIAGENGSGKTNILETLANFLNLGSFDPLGELNYEINGVTYTLTPADNNSNLGFHKRKNNADGTEKLVVSNKNNSRASIEEDMLDIRHYGCVYSKARSGFGTKAIKSSTTEQLDNSKYENDEKEDFTQIKQMLVDIQIQDDRSWARMSSTGTTMTYDQFAQTSKTYRFQKAFNEFFQGMQYDGIDEGAAEALNVIFNKNNHSISIDNLSTGEKQVVFRGAYLLRNSKTLEGGTVLIDEPELSMHPKWQEKIFEYYRGLFNKNNTQTVQMILATHSENVVRAALKDPDNVLVIILNNENGIVKADKIHDRVLPTIMAAEVNYLAFDIKSIDYHIALYGDLQSQTGKTRIVDMDGYIETQPEYNNLMHEKDDNTSYGHYKTLPTYIRNAIDHPDSGRVYTEEDLEKSIVLLRAICKRLRNIP